MHEQNIPYSPSLSSIQIGHDLLVTYGGYRMAIEIMGRVTLILSDGNGDFAPIEMPKMYREDYALCNYDDRSVYVSGGE